MLYVVRELEISMKQFKFVGTPKRIKQQGRNKLFSVENIQRVLVYSVFPITLVIALINVLSRHSSRYYFSLLSEPQALCTRNFLVLYMFESGTVLLPIGAMYYYVIILCIYVYCTAQWLRHLR